MSESRHGNRHEIRQLWTTTQLTDVVDWPGLRQAARITSQVTRRGQTTRETRYVLTSLSPTEVGPRRLLGLIRDHWRIENSLHWVRDVTFDEDRCTVRSGNAPRALATLRNGVIGYLHARKEPNIAAALRRLAGRPRAALSVVTRPLMRRM